MNKEFKELVAKILKLNSDFEDIKRAETISWDSMKHAELVVKIQNHYKVRLELSDILKVEKISDFYTLIKPKP